MSAPDAIAVEYETPSHCLGQYTAWRLPDRPQSAFDMMWVSIAKAQAPAAHRVLPHGEPSIAISRRRDKDGEINDIALTVCGPLRRADWYDPEPREELIAIRLMPELAAAIFDVAPADYFDQPPVMTAASLEAACAQTLRLSEVAAPKDIARQLIGDLRRYAGGKTIDDTPEAFAAAILRQTNGAARGAAIAKHLEISERTLRRRFRDHLGCSPKTYARQLRLTAAALAAEQTAKPQWAAIAA
ncbi:MAG: helix-turn-helix domain-containing protein, partial [Hyphococcus sp.]